MAFAYLAYCFLVFTDSVVSHLVCSSVNSLPISEFCSSYMKSRSVAFSIMPVLGRFINVSSAVLSVRISPDISIFSRVVKLWKRTVCRLNLNQRTRRSLSVPDEAQ